MCLECFKKYTDEPVINDRVLAMRDMIVGARESRTEPDWTTMPTKPGPGGVILYDYVTTQTEYPTEPNDPDYSTLLHVIVADMNVDDRHFDLIDDADLAQTYAEAEPWETAIFDALAQLTEEERATAIALEWGYTPDQMRDYVERNPDD